MYIRIDSFVRVDTFKIKTKKKKFNLKRYLPWESLRSIFFFFFDVKFALRVTHNGALKISTYSNFYVTTDFFSSRGFVFIRCRITVSIRKLRSERIIARRFLNFFFFDDFKSKSHFSVIFFRLRFSAGDARFPSQVFACTEVNDLNFFVRFSRKKVAKPVGKRRGKKTGFFEETKSPSGRTLIINRLDRKSVRVVSRQKQGKRL